MTLSGLNWWAVIAAIVVNMILGFLWYGPVFGKVWMKLVGKKEDDLPQNFTIYIIPVLATLFSAIVISFFMKSTGLSGLFTAVISWFGFVALTTYTNDLFEGRSAKLWIINNGYHLVGFILTGILLDLFG